MRESNPLSPLGTSGHIEDKQRFYQKSKVVLFAAAFVQSLGVGVLLVVRRRCVVVGVLLHFFSVRPECYGPTPVIW